MRVRAVVVGPASQLQIEVLDELVLEGNSALFRCHIPAFASAFVQLVDWLELPTEAAFTVQSTSLAGSIFAGPATPSHLRRRTGDSNQTSAGERYFVDPKTGDLHIVDVDASLNYRSYKCRCKNKLTGELVSSINKGKLIVSESHSPIGPRRTYSTAAASSGPFDLSPFDSSSSRSPAQLAMFAPASSLRPAGSVVVHEEGELALLACQLQAFPRAQISWSKRINELESFPLQIESRDAAGELRYAQVANLLFIRRAQRNDSGSFLCLARNSAGEERAEVELQVRG